jgi:hypothetical protein
MRLASFPQLLAIRASTSTGTFTSSVTFMTAAIPSIIAFCSQALAFAACSASHSMTTSSWHTRTGTAPGHSPSALPQEVQRQLQAVGTGSLGRSVEAICELLWGRTEKGMCFFRMRLPTECQKCQKGALKASVTVGTFVTLGFSSNTRPHTEHRREDY